MADLVDVGVVTFASNVRKTGFERVDTMAMPELAIDGCKAMGACISSALEHGGKRPMVIVISDGEPTDDMTTATAEIARREGNGKVGGYGIAVTDAAVRPLSQVLRRPVPSTIGFKESRELEAFVKEALGQKHEEAMDEYRKRAAELAAEYGFKIAGLPGRPRKKRQPRRERSNGEHVEEQAAA